MANKSLFKSFVGPAADALNEEQAPAYALSPKQQLAQYAATGCHSHFRKTRCSRGFGSRKLINLDL